VILVATWEADAPGRQGLELLGAVAGLARQAFFVSLAAASNSPPDVVVAALADLAREREARLIFLPADEQGAEIAPRLAERLGGTAVTHVVGVEEKDGRLVWTRPVFGGKALASVVATVEPVVATLRRGAFEAAPAGAAVEIAGLTVPESDGAVELLGTEAAASGAALEEAAVIVAGGAGMGGSEGFAELEELAGLLGGAVGASLAAVDSGWAPPERQVGLTGKSVSPAVYLAFGISGASQHLAGIGGAKAVVAVNTDPDAPIFRAARLGVVMDCRQLAAALIAELRR
jgi:electron transfer flavoprotein alpha subunit